MHHLLLYFLHLLVQLQLYYSLLVLQDVGHTKGCPIKNEDEYDADYKANGYTDSFHEWYTLCYRQECAANITLVVSEYGSNNILPLTCDNTYYSKIVGNQINLIMLCVDSLYYQYRFYYLYK